MDRSVLQYSEWDIMTSWIVEVDLEWNKSIDLREISGKRIAREWAMNLKWRGKVGKLDELKNDDIINRLWNCQIVLV